MELSNSKDFYLATKDKNGFLIYSSDTYKLLEVDLLSIIKICIIEGRNKTIGKRILEIYRDSTKDRMDLTIGNLNKIGIKDEECKPIHRTKTKHR